MTFDEFITKRLDKKADFDGKYDGQCVDLFRFYVQEVVDFPQPMGVGGAANFWSNYETDPNLNKYYDKIPNTPTGVPLKGDIPIWNTKAGGGYGHVSIFIEGDTKKFVSFDQNWPTLSKCTKTEHTYTNVLGWFRPKASVVTPTTEVMDYKAALEQSEATVKAFTEFRKQLADKLKSEDQTTAIMGSVERFLVLEDQLRSMTSKYEEAARGLEEEKKANEGLMYSASKLQEQIKALQGVEKDLKKANEELELLRQHKILDRFRTWEIIVELFDRIRRKR